MTKLDRHEATAEPRSLDQLRAAIDEVDARLLADFAARQALGDEIYRAKEADGLPVRNVAREVEKRRANPDYAPLLSALMRLSRERQYRRAYAAGADFPIGEEILSAPRTLPAVAAVATQGELSSYGAQAARLLFPDASILPVRSFYSAVRQVLDDNVPIAVLPLENSSSGTVHEVYELLTRHRLYIVAAVSVGIQHRLLGLPGAQLSDIRRVVSHPQALSQCSTIIQGMGWQVEESQNTAYAARHVAALQDPQVAALASEEAGLSHGLRVLSDEVANVEQNQTQFIALARRPVITDDATRLSLLLSLPHQSGTLAELLATLADLDLNLSRIQSLPVPRRPWEYAFYLDIEAPARDRAVLEALYQFSQELPSLRLLGWYAVGQSL